MWPHSSPLRRRHQGGPSWSRLRLSQSTVPLIVRLVLQVGALPRKRLCLLWSSQHPFGYVKQSPHRCSVSVVWWFLFKLWGSIRWACFQMVSLCQCLFCTRTHDQARNRPTVLVVSWVWQPSEVFAPLLIRFNGHRFVFCFFGHKQTSTLIPQNRIACCRVCWMPCWHHGSARCSVDCKRDFCLHPLSDLTPTACPTDSMLWTVNLLHTQ